MGSISIVCNVCGRPWEGEDHTTEVCVKRLQTERDSLREALADLEEYALLMKTRIDQVDAPSVGGKE